MNSDDDKSATELWGYEFGCEGVMPIKEAAKFIAASPNTVRRRVDEGRIRMGKDGLRRTVICKRSLREYLKRLEV